MVQFSLHVFKPFAVMNIDKCQILRGSCGKRIAFSDSVFVPSGNVKVAQIRGECTGYAVKTDMPQSGAELEELYRSGALWLQGCSEPSNRSAGTTGQYLLKTVFGPV
jgi:hypothetical protein